MDGTYFNNVKSMLLVWLAVGSITEGSILDSQTEWGGLLVWCLQ